MEINPDDIIQLIFFSALFLMVIAVPKIVLRIFWFFYSYWIYSTKSPFLQKVMKKQYGDAIEVSRKAEANKNIVKLIERTVASLKDPILESVASVFIIVITLNHLSLNSDSMNIMILIIIMQLMSIIFGFVVIAWALLKSRSYIDEVFNNQLMAESKENYGNN